MRLSLVITLIYAAGLTCGLPTAHNENDDLSVTSMNDVTSQQEGISNFRVYHKIDNISQLFDFVLKGQGGIDTGNNGNSNGDDGSHKPPSKRFLTTDQAHILQWHHSFSELPYLTWNHKAEDLAQARVNNCTSGEKQSYNERIAIGHTSWNDVLSAWWDKNMEWDDTLKKTLSQSTSQKKFVSVGCAMQTCPRGRYYACNYVLPSGGVDHKS